MYKKILVPTDGSKNSKRAIKHALSLINNINSEIMILNVVEPYYPPESMLPMSTLPNLGDTVYNELKSEGKIIVDNFKEEFEKN